MRKENNEPIRKSTTTVPTHYLESTEWKKNVDLQRQNNKPMAYWCCRYVFFPSGKSIERKSSDEIKKLHREMKAESRNTV